MSRSKRDILDTERMLERLTGLLTNHGTMGDFRVPRQDAEALRRISMTLHTWHELECGNSNEHVSWTIVRGKKVKTYTCTQCGHKGNGAGSCATCGDIAPLRQTTFEDDEAGKPYLERHFHNGHSTPTYSPIPDREAGAMKRLKKIMSRYPALTAYVQGDPRGCALYILKPGDVPEGENADAYYSRGLAVFK